MTAIISKSKRTQKAKACSKYTQMNPHLGRRIICPHCGNEWNFYQIAEEVKLTTRYIQNADGSFTPLNDDSRILGEVKLYCGECQADLSEFHNRFLEMLF
ncbi:MAG: hypothetical protein R6T90_09375 [Dissulfuribacterales bacterium]